MTKNSYAYAITVNSRKRSGGITHASSMEEVVRKVAKSHNMTVRKVDSVIRPCDGKIITSADWILDGKKAFLYVYAPPELFLDIGKD